MQNIRQNSFLCNKRVKMLMMMMMMICIFLLRSVLFVVHEICIENESRVRQKLGTPLHVTKAPLTKVKKREYDNFPVQTRHDSSSDKACQY